MSIVTNLDSPASLRHAYSRKQTMLSTALQLAAATQVAGGSRVPCSTPTCRGNRNNWQDIPRASSQDLFYPQSSQDGGFGTRPFTIRIKGFGKQVREKVTTNDTLSQFAMLEGTVVSPHHCLLRWLMSTIKHCTMVADRGDPPS